MAYEPDLTSTIRICERCYAPIEADEQYYRLAHIHRARPDGGIDWAHAYVHIGACAAPAGPGCRSDATPDRHCRSGPGSG